jgi:hypothetical protein
MARQINVNNSTVAAGSVSDAVDPFIYGRDGP